MYGTAPNNSGQDYSDILISKRTTQEYLRQNGLRKNLTTGHLWGISVGAVISGQFIGWNNGLDFVNPFGLLCMTAVIAVFYVLIVTTLTRLSIAYPYAGGSYAYSRKAFGKLPGFLAGYVTLIEYLCITAVIFVYMDFYIEGMLSQTWSDVISILVFGILILLQVTGITKSSFFQLMITSLCVSIFLLFFMGINSVEGAKLPIEISFINGIPGFFLAIPYVLWFFVGIDVLVMTAEEMKNPPKSVPVSFYSGLITIIALSFGIIYFSVSSVYWPALRGADYPLIFILQKIQQGDMVLLAVFSFFSLSSFVASLNGMMTGYSRQVFSLARAGYLPKFMDKILDKSKAPLMALIAPGFLVLVIAETGDTTVLIQIVCVCAVASYAFSLSAYIRLMRIERAGFRRTAPAYLAQVACLVLLIGFFIFQTVSSLITFGIFVFGVVYYYLFAKGRINRDAPEEVEANLDDINIIITNI